MKSRAFVVQKLWGLGFIVVLPWAFCANAKTYAWTNAAGGNWNVATNWSPNGVPGSGDTANITNAGTYAVTLNAAINVNSLTLGGAASGVQTVQGSGFNLQATSALINSGSVLTLTNLTFTGSVTNASGGVLSVNGATLEAQVTVASGGELLVWGPGVNIGQSGQAGDPSCWLWVQSGGQLNAANDVPVYLYSVMTNAGLVNLTNQVIDIYNNGTSGAAGGLVNQAGGVIDLWANAGIKGNNYGSEYLVNQGTINLNSGTGASTINVYNLTNTGTMTTQPGTGELNIGFFNGLESLTGIYNAAPGTVIEFYADTSPGTSAGEGLTLVGAGEAGAGAYRFVQGLLTLPTNVLSGLALDGGALALGAEFQGGAITNLAVSGIIITSGLPIIGTLVMTNGALYTTNTLTNGASLSLHGTTLNGSLVITNNGLLTASGASLDAQVTVASGGEILVLGTGVNIGQNGQAGDSSYWLWVQSGGQLNAADDVPVYLYSVMTNAGLVNLTNQVIDIYNSGMSGAAGGLVNQAGGVIDLWENAGIKGNNYGSEYLVNRGTINLNSGTGASTVNVYNLTNTGTMTTQPGTGELNIGFFNGLGSLTGIYNAAPGTVIEFYADNSPGTSAGEGLTLVGAGEAGAGAYRFVQGLLTLPTNVLSGLALDGGALALGAEFQGGAITNLAVSGIIITSGLPIIGTLVMTNGALYTTNTLTNGASLSLYGTTLNGSLVITNNGLLTASGASLDAQVTVASGGEILVLGTGVNIGQNGQAGDPSYWLWVQSGGQVNAADDVPVYLYSVMTNAGLVNLTNQVIDIYNSGMSGAAGGLVNQTGGVIDLWDNAGIKGNNYGSEYLVNQGTINLSSGTGASSVDVFNLTNSGTMTTQPGTGQLDIGYFNGLESLTGTYSAAPGTVIEFYADGSPGTSVGEGLTLVGAGEAGAGAYRFVQGLLTLPTNVVPGLALDGGALALGTDFQGGAITNLTVSGVTLTSGLPIIGTLVMTNGALYTTNTLGNGASLSLYGTTLNGSIIITNNGLLTASATALDAQVTVENGGKMLVSGQPDFSGSGVSIGQNGQAGDPNYWLWVQNGGQVNTVSGAPLYLYSGMTNAGLVNVTNQVIDIYNSGMSGAAGGLVNQAGGVIDLWDGAGIKGNTFGSEYLINQGTIDLSGGPGTSGIDMFNFTNTGTLSAQLGTLQLQATHLILQPSETLSVGLGGAGDYGTIAITGNALLVGAFSLQSENGFVPRAGQTFTVLTYGSHSGAFSSFSLPGAAVAFQPVYGTNALTVAVQPLFALQQETNLVFNANGPPGSQSVLLSSTNLTVPLIHWTPVATNTFDIDGYLTFTTNLPPDKPQEFFIQELQ